MNNNPPRAMVSIFIINDMTPKEKKAAYNLAWYHKNKGNKDKI